MSLKTAIVSRVASNMFSADRLLKKRAETERKRKAKGAPHEVHYFHQTDDPYSHLTAQILPEFQRRYGVTLIPHLVPRPPDWAAPDRQRLIDWSRRDAAMLARETKYEFTDPGEQPTDQQVEATSRRLAAALDEGGFTDKAAAISAALWSPGAPVPDPYFATEARTLELMTEGEALRDELKHYLGATFYYGGEWYWGLDRIAYLEQRLRDLGLLKVDDVDALPFLYWQHVDFNDGPKIKPAPVIDFFVSFRSPYSYLAAMRIFDMAEAYGAEVRIKNVLPMVMRGLVVPKTKGRYIMADTAREARRLEIPFGKIADPVGEPVERAYAILPWAIEQGKGREFTQSFLRGVWSEGIDAGSDSGLEKLVTRAGLDWDHAKSLMGSDGWRAKEAAHQEEMLALGLWGVPSFQLGDVSCWGNDRLWVIERELQRLAKKRGLLGKIGL